MDISLLGFRAISRMAVESRTPSCKILARQNFENSHGEVNQIAGNGILLPISGF